MRLRERLQTWWQIRTGEEDTPFDGATPAWLVSMALHLGLLILLTVILRELPQQEGHVELVTSIIQPDTDVPKDFFFSHLDKVEIGANSIDGAEMADAVAELEQDITEIAAEEEIVEDIDLTVGEIVMESIVDESMAMEADPNMLIQGAAGAGTTGAAGAVDRITQEIIDSLQDRKTLVVWMFDQSVSLSAQRAAIYQRLDRIYEELNVIEASGDPRFAHHHDKPLLSSVMAFGENITFRTPEPTDRLPEIKAAVAGIENDASGLEHVFQAVYMAAEKYKKYTMSRDRRNVMIVVFTDEAGDDGKQMLNQAVDACRRNIMPVYVVGIPSPFGRQEVDVKWVDPDPAFDQTPQWTQVRQGPETMLPERVKLAFAGDGRNEEPLDSGFGPFALTRLAVETSGIYFSVHPNRNIDRPVRKSETAHLSAYIKYFFDPDTMQRYRPDYVSSDEFARLLRKNKAKMSLVKASAMSWVHPVEDPKLVFRRRSEPELITELSAAQQKSAKLLAGTLTEMAAELKRGASDREKIVRPRWQAGYDLAMGRTMSAVIRAEGYNLMLAQARRGMKFKDPKNDTWELKPSDKVMSGSSMEKDAAQAGLYLQRVVDEHPGTPWALLAKRELSQPLGWEWTEKFTNVNPPPTANPGNNNNNPPNPRDDQKRMIPKKQMRPPPKL